MVYYFSMSNELRPFTNAVHAEIRGWLGKRNLSQRQLAEKAGISKSKISRILGTGEQAVDVDELDSMCEVLGVSPEALVNDAVRSMRAEAAVSRPYPNLQHGYALAASPDRGPTADANEEDYL